MKYDVETVAEYLGELAPERREALETLRGVVFQVAPEAAEALRYGMPAYDVGERELCLIASQKQYVSLYLDPTILDKHRDDLKGLSLGKSCVRFRKLDQLPLETIERMLRDAADDREENDGEG